MVGLLASSAEHTTLSYHPIIIYSGTSDKGDSLIYKGQNYLSQYVLYSEVPLYKKSSHLTFSTSFLINHLLVVWFIFEITYFHAGVELLLFLLQLNHRPLQLCHLPQVGEIRASVRFLTYTNYLEYRSPIFGALNTKCFLQL